MCPNFAHEFFTNVLSLQKIINRQHTKHFMLSESSSNVYFFSDLVFLVKSRERVSSEEMQTGTEKEQEHTSEKIGQIYIYYNKISTISNYIIESSSDAEKESHHEVSDEGRNRCVC